MSCRIHAVCKDCYAGLVDVGQAVPVPKVVEMYKAKYYEDLTYAMCCCCGESPPAIFFAAPSARFARPCAHNPVMAQTEAAIHNVNDPVEREEMYKWILLP